MTEFEHDSPRFPPLLDGDRWRFFCTRGGLTPREAEVLGLICRGLNNRAICHALGVRQNTLRSHIRATLRKLGCRNRVEAVLMVAHARDRGAQAHAWES